ncbi:MAG: aldose epimerase [Acidothermus sp.]|nr:aldose epimerase [Acidothermus sp.]
MSHAPHPPSATVDDCLIHLGHGDRTLVVSRLGAAVQEFRIADRDIFQPTQAGEAGAFSGAVLVPWPNRVAGGRYWFDGEEYRLAVNEPETGSALHGLAFADLWHPADVGQDFVLLHDEIGPVGGFPFQLAVSVRYSLGHPDSTDSDLTVEIAARNIGDRPCPFAAGFHPYLAAGTRDGGEPATVDECRLTVGVRRRFRLDSHQVPVGDEPFHALASGMTLAGRRLDDAFLSATPAADGFVHARLDRPDGYAIDLWAEPVFAYWQVYTGDKRPPALARRGVAVEPMTAAPNAFNNRLGLRVLAAGEEFKARWGVRVGGILDLGANPANIC